MINTIPTTPEILPFVLESSYQRKEAVFVWGPPGIGKSSIIAQWVKSKNNWDFHDVRLTTMDASDMRGLPSIDSSSRRTLWNLPEFIPANNTEEEKKHFNSVHGVIFLDELTAAEPNMQASAYELLNERTIGGHPIPPNYWVVAAGNSTEDNSISYRMGAALADRFVHVKMITSPQDWLKWAVEEDVHPAVLSFIKVEPSYLNPEISSMSNENIIMPTPRSWDRVSRILKQDLSALGVPEQHLEKTIHSQVYGRLGETVSAKFFATLREIRNLPDMEELLNASPAKQLEMVPANTSAYYGLTYSALALVIDLNTAESVLKLFRNVYLSKKAKSLSEKDMLPRKEIATVAIELLLQKVTKLKLTRQFLALKELKDYQKETYQEFM